MDDDPRIKEETVLYLLDRLDECGICVPLDKRPQDFAVVWTYLLLRKLLNYVIRSDPTLTIPLDLEQRHNAMVVKFAYAGTTHRVAHEFGQFSFWLKASAYVTSADWSVARMTQDKYRPTRSYKHHRLRSLLSLCCKGLLFMLQVMIQSTISVRSAIEVALKFRRFNDKLITQGDGRTLEQFSMTVDADSFFNGIGWELIRTCLVMGHVERKVWWPPKLLGVTTE